MKNRGRQKVVRLTFFAAALLPLVVWVLYAGAAFVQYLFSPAPPGQMLYLLSKLSGMMAAALIVAQVTLALMRRLPSSPPSLRPTRHLHRTIGLAIAAAVTGHIALFMGAVALRTGTVPWHYLTPVVNGDYYRTSITLGWLALIILAVVIPCGLIMARLKHYNHRALQVHRCAIPAAVIALLHSYLIGTESWLLLILLAIFPVAVWLIRQRHHDTAPEAR
ncbi:hypothetical protein FKG94_01020 [Exilibacterium tricleocarpae]|uniref:Ferric oxidoreductase domain-containing protein n=1 Tax=Exilibacterium tricleocarpae TaxID=2591008 RepID=A0A545U9L5_9GAMM|nr:hypothetical protein [Exilibacterium tricleocarpae]TQV86166.1 hypothetical protein FKG94_01020 [Exilibacterium tricleocarpae]